MDRIIKHIRPSSRYKSGVIDPKSCKRLFESQKDKPVIYRSSYEKDFIYWLETNRNVEMWGSECLAIPYTKQDGSRHTYYPDFVVKMTNGDTYIIEIKPFSQTHKPARQNNQYDWNNYVNNMQKWHACKDFCERNGMIFRVLTEKTIKQLA